MEATNLLKRIFFDTIVQIIDDVFFYKVDFNDILPTLIHVVSPMIYHMIINFSTVLEDAETFTDEEIKEKSEEFIINYVREYYPDYNIVPRDNGNIRDEVKKIEEDKKNCQ